MKVKLNNLLDNILLQSWSYKSKNLLGYSSRYIQLSVEIRCEPSSTNKKSETISSKGGIHDKSSKVVYTSYIGGHKASTLRVMSVIQTRSNNQRRSSLREGKTK